MGMRVGPALIDHSDGPADWTTKLGECLRTGDMLDVSNLSDNSREIPAHELRAVLIHPPAEVDPRGLTVIGARVNGRLDLDNATIRFPITLGLCEIPWGITADTSHLHSLDLSGTTLANPDGFALNLDSAQIDGNVSVGIGFKATGGVRAIGARISGRLSLTGATLNNPNGTALTLSRAEVKGGVIVRGDFKATGAFNAQRAHIGSRLTLTGATLTNPDGNALNLDGAQIDGSVDMDAGFSANGGVSAVGVRIKGQLSLTRATLTNSSGPALVLDSAQIDGAVLARDELNVEGVMRAVGACINSQLVLEGRFTSVELSGSTLTALILRPVALSCLGIVGTDIGALSTPAASMPVGTVVTSGTRVKRISGRIAYDWKAMRGWLSNTPAGAPFDPEPWHMFAEIYRQHGYPAGATRLHHHAAKLTAELSPRWTTRAGGALYNGVTGHGYRPLRSVATLLLIIALTWGLIGVSRQTFIPTNPVQATAAAKSHHAQNSNDPLPQSITGVTPCGLLSSDTNSYPCLDGSAGLAMAAANTLPLSVPNNDWRTINASIATALLLLRILGWITAVLLLAGLTGLLKKSN